MPSLQKISKTARVANSKLTYIVLFLILAIGSYAILEHNRETNRDEYLHETTMQYTQNYNNIYLEYKKISNLIFKLSIDTPQIQALFYKRDREKLYYCLSDTYKLLKNYNIKQFQFHLPNNHSFLRVHRPDKYGDDLTQIRKTVRYVNTYRKPVDGFEEGRVNGGYRFVFPMYYKKIYIGSVETSFSTLAMNIEFSKRFKIPSYFFILKDKIDKKVFKDEKKNYMKSPFKQFYQEIKTNKYITKRFSTNTHLNISSNTKKLIDSLAKQKESFSIYDSNLDAVLTFIKVKNPISYETIGLFTAISDAKLLHQQNVTFQISLTALLFGILAILFFIYNENIYKLNLRNINETLEDKIEKEVNKNREKDKAMFQQSRLAQMGEMVSMIAHQWRQPLTAISATSASLVLKSQFDTLDNETAEDLGKKISEYTQHLSSTIDDFRDFFKPNKECAKTTYKELVNSVLGIVEASIKNNNINFKQKLQNETALYTYRNEIKQVILNLIKNAEDILKEKEIQNPTITIEANGYILRVKDNAGGVPDDIIDKVFNPYFSTKKEKNGTGLGLYMSKTIVEEHCGGKLSVYNDAEGAVFEIELPAFEEIIE